MKGKSVVCGVTGLEGSRGVNGSPNLANAVGDDKLCISIAICRESKSFLR